LLAVSRFVFQHTSPSSHLGPSPTRRSSDLALVPLMARKAVDLDRFALLPFGGAGPTHGFLLAREVGIQRVIVPPNPGVLCAIGRSEENTSGLQSLTTLVLRLMLGVV